MDIIIKPISQIQEEHEAEFFKHSQNRQAFIDMIKEEVGHEVDYDHPIPVFQQVG